MGVLDMFQWNTILVINSKFELFTFTLDNNGGLLYKIDNSQLNQNISEEILLNNVIRFSTSISADDVIHLMALLDDGNLIYSQYRNKIWDKLIIGHFDIRSNHYHQFEIIIVKDILHMIYSYSNLINSNICTIQHVVYGQSKRHNVIRYISSKFPEPFSLDVDDQGIIHLLYPAFHDRNTKIYYTFYNPFTNTWSPSPKLVSSNIASARYPFLFIDTKNNIHNLWIEESKNKSAIKYHKVNANGIDKFVWKEINLSTPSLNMSYPIIFEEKDMLIMQFFSDKTLNTLLSTDLGNTWDTKNNECFSDPLVLTKVNTNLRVQESKIKYGISSLSIPTDLCFFKSYPMLHNKIILDKGKTEEEKSTKGEEVLNKKIPWYRKIF